jgi:hypothetical protein
MTKHSMKLAACISVLGAMVLASDAMALNQVQCQDLPGNMFLAAIERGDCDLNIQTAAGPQEEVVVVTTNKPRDGRTGGRGGSSTEKSDGGEKSGGSTRGGRAHP